MNQEWTSNTDIGSELGNVGYHLLAIVGPSGSGKTTNAVALAKRWDRAFIVPIYTTRSPRTDDTHGYYRYVSELEFSALEQLGRFFICRKAPFPRYGWMREDFMTAVRSGLIAILPFRHGGARFLLDIIPKMMIVFIEPSPESVSLRSTGRIKIKGEEDAASVIQGNRLLRELAVAKGWPTKTLQNHFSGVDEVKQHAQATMDWAQECYARKLTTP